MHVFIFFCIKNTSLIALKIDTHYQKTLRVGNSLFRSFDLGYLTLVDLKRATVSDSLLSLFKKEPLWANQSRLTLKKSNCEQIAFVAVYNRATLSKLLSIYLKKSDISDSRAIQANRFQKTSDLLEKNVFFVCFRQFSSFFMPKERIPPVALHSVALFLRSTGWIRSCCSLQKNNHVQIASVVLYKRATLSKLIPTIFKKERREQFALFHEQIALSLFQSQKSRDLLE